MDDDTEINSFESYPRCFIITLNNRYDILEKEQPSVTRYITECFRLLDSTRPSKNNYKSIDCTGHLLDIPLEEIYIIFNASFNVNCSNNTMRVYVKYKSGMFSGDRVLSKTYDVEPSQKFISNNDLKDKIIHDIETQPEKSIDDDFIW